MNENATDDASKVARTSRRPVGRTGVDGLPRPTTQTQTAVEERSTGGSASDDGVLPATTLRPPTRPTARPPACRQQMSERSESVGIRWGLVRPRSDLGQYGTRHAQRRAALSAEIRRRTARRRPSLLMLPQVKRTCSPYGERRTGGRTDRCSDGQTGGRGRMDRRTDGQTGGRKIGYVGPSYRQSDGWPYERTDGRSDGRTDGWTDGRSDGWTDGRTDGRTDG